MNFCRVLNLSNTHKGVSLQMQNGGLTPAPGDSGFAAAPEPFR